MRPAHHSNNLHSQDGYNIFRRDRKKCVGGGVAVFINQHAPAIEIVDVPVQPNYEDSIYFEFIWIASVLDGSDLIIGAVYHPPKPKYLVSELFTYLNGVLEHFNNTYVDHIIVLAGDFNTLSDVDICALGLINIVDQPTHA